MCTVLWTIVFLSFFFWSLYCLSNYGFWLLLWYLQNLLNEHFLLEVIHFPSCLQPLSNYAIFFSKYDNPLRPYIKYNSVDIYMDGLVLGRYISEQSEIYTICLLADISTCIANWHVNICSLISKVLSQILQTYMLTYIEIRLCIIVTHRVSTAGVRDAKSLAFVVVFIVSFLAVFFFLILTLIIQHYAIRTILLEFRET